MPAQWMFSVVFGLRWKAAMRKNEPGTARTDLGAASCNASAPGRPPRCFLLLSAPASRCGRTGYMPRALMFHHFRRTRQGNYLVALHVVRIFAKSPSGSFFETGQTVRPHACRRRPYLTRSLPTLDLSYTSSPLEDPAAKASGSGPRRESLRNSQRNRWRRANRLSGSGRSRHLRHLDRTGSVVVL